MSHFVFTTGYQWQLILKDLVPRTKTYEHFGLWEWDGTLERIQYSLYVQVRKRAGKEASPTAAIVDSQSVKAAERGGASIDLIGYDAGKKIKGIKRHIFFYTLDMILEIQIQPASVQDRDGLLPVFTEARCQFVVIKNNIC